MRSWLSVLLLLLGVVPLEADARDKPHRRLPDHVRGEMLYERHCIMCHGATVAGDGPATEALVADVPDLREVIDAGRRDEQARVVLEGRGAMPAFDASFDRYDARRILRHMQRIATGEPSVDEPEADDTESADDADAAQ